MKEIETPKSKNSTPDKRHVLKGSILKIWSGKIRLLPNSHGIALNFFSCDSAHNFKTIPRIDNKNTLKLSG